MPGMSLGQKKGRSVTDSEFRKAREAVKAARTVRYSVSWEQGKPDPVLLAAEVDIGPSWARGTFWGYEDEAQARANGWWPTPERALAEEVLYRERVVALEAAKAKAAERAVGACMAGKMPVKRMAS